MNAIQTSRRLRAALLVDAAASAPLGLLQAAASGTLAALLGLSPTLVLATGVFMLAYPAALVLLARSAVVPRAAVRVVIGGNAGWAAGCAALATLAPAVTGWGVAYLLLQAVAVLGFALLQARGLAQSAPAPVLQPQRA